MTKSELIEKMVEESGLTKAQAKACLEAMTEVISSALIKGDSVQLTGFGSFGIKESKEREGRNPQTGEAITIAASKRVFFKAGKVLKEAVRD